MIAECDDRPNRTGTRERRGEVEHGDKSSKLEAWWEKTSWSRTNDLSGSDTERDRPEHNNT